MTIMFYVIVCFLKVDAAGRRIIVSKNTSLRKKKKKTSLRKEQLG